MNTPEETPEEVKAEDPPKRHIFESAFAVIDAMNEGKVNPKAVYPEGFRNSGD